MHPPALLDGYGSPGRAVYSELQSKGSKLIKKLPLHWAKASYACLPCRMRPSNAWMSGVATSTASHTLHWNMDLTALHFCSTPSLPRYRQLLFIDIFHCAVLHFCADPPRSLAAPPKNMLSISFASVWVQCRAHDASMPRKPDEHRACACGCGSKWFTIAPSRALCFVPAVRCTRFRSKTVAGVRALGKASKSWICNKFARGRGWQQFVLSVLTIILTMILERLKVCNLRFGLCGYRNERPRRNRLWTSEIERERERERETERERNVAFAR